MESKKYAVIFDTNSYRQFVNSKSTEDVVSCIKDIVNAESKKKIKAFGSAIVGLEMLGNLSEGESGLNYRDCLNGIIAMGNHCFDDNLKAPRIIPHAYLHIARSFFGTVPKKLENNIKNIGGFIDNFRENFEEAVSHHMKNTIIDVKRYIDREENSFSTNIVQLIDGLKNDIVSKHPRIAKRDLRNKLIDFILNDQFDTFIGLAIIIMTASNLKIILPENESINRAISLSKEFPLSVGFYKWICHKIVHDNINMQSKPSKEKRWNWLWDYHISFVIAKSTLDNREAILVTSDGDLSKILNHFGYKNRVMTITEYLHFIGL